MNESIFYLYLHPLFQNNNKMNNIKGFIFGILTAATFGLIPLFTLPLMAKGMQFDSILFYRFLIATISLAIISLAKKESLRIDKKDLPVLLLLGFFYTASAMFLFWGYNFMSAGIATTFHFTYPIFVTLTMMIFFKERTSWITLLAIILAISGVGRLSIEDGEFNFQLVGIFIVLLSAIGYALYIVTVNKSRVNNMNSKKMTFYVFLVSTVLFAIKAMTNTGIQPIPDNISVVNLFLLALVPTIISNMTLVLAVRHIGGTLTSILGAFEPITAVLVSVLVFGDPFTPNLATGIVLIITAVTLIILSKTIQQNIYKLIHRKH